MREGAGEGDVGMAYLPPQGQTQGPSLMDTGRERRCSGVGEGV